MFSSRVTKPTRTSPTWKRARRLAVVSVLAVLTSACQSPSDPTSTDPTSTDPTSTDPTSTGPTSTAPTSTAPEATNETSSSPPPPGTDPTPVPTYVDEAGFDDHTVPAVGSVDELMTLARSGASGEASIKFTIPDFDKPADTPSLARTHLLDGNFYNLHDEWYFYRLLNGQPIPGADVAPVAGQHFATIADIYTWAESGPPSELPLELTFSGERLYAEAFYDLALHTEPRTHGVGSIVRLPDPVAGEPDHWLIELEYSDTVTPEHVAQFFRRLAPALPQEVGANLEWVVRSPQHEEVATLMQADQLPFYDRITYFRDLVTPGTVAVYSEGITAGRLLYVGEEGASLSEATATDIIVTEHVPDWLPPTSAMITSDPQTPLAHVNLLARNRGIPNASQAGVTEDPGLRQAARVRAYAIVVARGPTLQIALITRDQYNLWRGAQKQKPVAVPPVDVGAVPLVVNLTDLVGQLSVDGVQESEVSIWRPVIGGKSAGFLTLLSTPGLTPPPDPLAITVKPYIQHVEPLRDMIAAVLAGDDFTSSPRARWLLLEGDQDYDTQFATEQDAEFAEQFLSSHPPGSPTGDVLAQGGLKAFIEAIPIDATTLAAITTELSRTYSNYDSSAGLRFRSSSSVEDIEGFNGAGLYTSYTGYLHPERLEDEDDRNKTVERAILRGWSSYWSFEAFEERRLAGIDHLSGAMGLTVHARFDDDLERNNGVATFTFLPGAGAGDAVLEINVQDGSVDVTNPDPADFQLPEVLRLIRSNGTIAIERVSGSTLMTGGQRVLEDEAVERLFEQTAAVAELWRARINASLADGQQIETVVLDFEFKTVEAGWPKLEDGADPYPPRLVLRQVRSLDPGLRAMSEEVRDLAIPRDVLMRAALVERLRCMGTDGATVDQVAVITDPLLLPDMGYSEQPLIIGADPTATTGAPCTRQVLFASPTRALVEILDSGSAFVIVG